MDTILDSLSSQRIDIYKKYMECDSDDEAVGLYLWNANLSREIGTIINIIEVSLRNSIQQSYMNINGTDENWLTTYFDSLPASNEGRKRINEVRSRIHKSSGVTINDIISRLHFGFWSSICSDEHLESKPDSLKMWPKMLDSVFKGRGHFTQSDIFSMIVRANYTRNRISHNEVVWKEDKRCGVFSVVRSVQEVCNNLFELASIIGIGNVKIIEMNDIFERISNFCNVNVIEEYKNIARKGLTNNTRCKKFDLSHFGEFDSGVVHNVYKKKTGEDVVIIKSFNIKTSTGKLREFMVSRNDITHLISVAIRKGDVVKFIPKMIPHCHPPHYGSFLAFSVSQL